MTSKERLLQFVEYKELTQKVFCTAAKLSNGFLTNNGEIGSGKLHNILQAYPEINLEWLVTGEGEMTKDLSTGEVKHNRSLVTDNAIDEQAVPLYDITATAGVVNLFDNASSAPIALEHIKIPHLPKCDGAISITGDSMYPLLKSGDIVLYRKVKNLDNIIYGEMYLIYIDNDGDEFFFTKYIHRSEDPQYIKLVSQNQHHHAVEFPRSSIKALAIVKASIRINSSM